MSSMTRHTSGLLKQLLGSVPEGFLVDSKWLTSRGFSRQLLHQYVEQGWLERAVQGVYRKPTALSMSLGAGGDWLVPLLSAQWMGYPVHVGGPTALQLLGHAHYLQLGAESVAYLYSDAPPSWLKRLELNTELRLRRMRLFSDADLGVADADPGNLDDGAAPYPWLLRLKASTAERAVLEALDELPDAEGFGVLDGVFESLTNLRPRMLESLLRDCRSVKVKRLFFVFADRHAHAWRKHLDADEFDLGTGDRQLVKGGRLHPAYRITVPADFMPATQGPN